MPGTRQKADAARAAARLLLSVPDAARGDALETIAKALAAGPNAGGPAKTAGDAVLAANSKDVAAAQAAGLDASLLDRLHLDADKLAMVAAGCRQLAAMPDPLGRTLRSTLLDDGLHLYQVTCPLGVIACIFESRPDVVVQIAALAIRTGNAVLLKGGKEAAHSNAALADVVRTAVAAAGLPQDTVQLLDGREEVQELLGMDDRVDLVIPRGSSALVRYVQDNTRIPVLGHAEGICHIYVDAAADLEEAVAVVQDAKLDYPAACNAVETVLVHESLHDWLPTLRSSLEAAGVEVRQGDDADFDKEYGAAILNLATVPSLEAALAHIERHGSGHTDAILTEDADAARAFVAGVDSAGVFVNASTRFADGYRYGLGAEVGISTSRIHARGPVGLEGLVSTRWILVGQGHTAATYRNRPFRHEPSISSFDPASEAWT